MPIKFSFFTCIAGVAGGATRAALTQHFALQNNAADISAKVLCHQIIISYLVPNNSYKHMLIVSFFNFDRKIVKKQLQQ